MPLFVTLPQSSDEEGARARPRRVDEGSQSGRVGFSFAPFLEVVVNLAFQYQMGPRQVLSKRTSSTVRTRRTATSII